MKRYSILALVVILMVAGNAQALVIGQMRSAQTLGMGSFSLTTGVGLFEHARDIYGTVRYGLAAPLDISGSLAIVDFDGADDPHLLFNADLQYQFMRADMGWALDMAFGAVFEYFSYEGIDGWSIGGNYIISKPVKLENGFAFTPYGRLNMRSDNVSMDLPEGAVGDNDASDFNIGVNLGSEFALSSKIKLIGEAQLDDDFGFIGGISFLMW